MLRKMRATTGWIFFEIFFTKYRNSCYATWAQIASTTVQDILDQYPNIKDSEQSIQEAYALFFLTRQLHLKTIKRNTSTQL